MRAIERLFNPGGGRWAATIVGVSWLVLLNPANSLGGESSEDNTTMSRTIVDRAPTEDTRESVDGLFSSAARLTVFYTPEDQMGRLGYNLKMARERARFQLTIDCRGGCNVEFQRLRDDFAKGLKIRGTCPGAIGTIIDFADQQEKSIGSISATAEGQCFTLNGQSYFLKDLSVRKRLEALSGVLQ